MSVVSLSAGRALNVINKMQQVHSSSIEAYICIGDFVQVNVFGDGDKFVGQVVDVALSYSDVPPREREDIEPVENEPLILVRLWELVTGATRSIGRLSNEDELVTRGLEEVMESDAGYWTSPHEVTSIAFVCHIDDIKNDRFGCLNGIFNVFFVRYSCVSGTPVLMSSTFNQFDHLKKLHSYSFRIFQTTIDLRDQFGKVFYREKQTQGNRVILRAIQIFPEYWNYILKRAKTCASMIVTEHTRNLCKKRWRHDLSQKKIRLQTLVTTIIAESTEAVDCLSSLFGSSFYLGLRNRFPKITEPTHHIQQNNVLNFVDCTHASLRNGITLKYDELACQVSIRVVFRDITLDSNIDRLIESLPNHVSRLITGSGVTYHAQNITEQEEDIAAGDDGAFFMMEGELYQVRTVQNDVVTAVRVDLQSSQNNLSITLTRMQCRSLINSYMNN